MMPTWMLRASVASTLILNEYGSLGTQSANRMLCHLPLLFLVIRLSLIANSAACMVLRCTIGHFSLSIYSFRVLFYFQIFFIFSACSSNMLCIWYSIISLKFYSSSVISLLNCLMLPAESGFFFFSAGGADYSTLSSTIYLYLVTSRKVRSLILLSLRTDSTSSYLLPPVEMLEYNVRTPPFSILYLFFLRSTTTSPNLYSPMYRGSRRPVVVVWSASLKYLQISDSSAFLLISLPQSSSVQVFSQRAKLVQSFRVKVVALFV